MDIAISEIKRPDMEAILPLYRDAGWTNYTGNPAMLAGAYRHSLKSIGAYDAGRMVGIIRAVGDGHSIVYIQDVIVLTAYRRKGIGSMLMREIMDRYKDAYQTVLLTDERPETVSFYRSLGFERAKDRGCAAFIRQKT